jgi:hypothetical protein
MNNFNLSIEDESVSRISRLDRISFIYWLNMLQNYHELSGYSGYSYAFLEGIVRRKLDELGGLGGVW